MSSEFIISGGACHQMELAFRRNEMGNALFNYLVADYHLKAVDDLRKGQIPKCWTDEHDNRHLILVSGGRDHSWWESNPKEAGFTVSPGAQLVLNKVDNSLGNGGVYHVVIRPGYRMAIKEEVTNVPLSEYARRRGWKLLNREACYLVANHPTSRGIGPDYNLKGLSLTDHHKISYPDGRSPTSRVALSLRGESSVEMGAYGIEGGSLDWCYNEWGFAFIVPWA